VALFIIVVGGVPILENPQSSLIMHHDRMVWLLQQLSRFKIVEPKWHWSSTFVNFKFPTFGQLRWVLASPLVFIFLGVFPPSQDVPDRILDAPLRTSKRQKNAIVGTKLQCLPLQPGIPDKG
jgi:hypothetical protein